MRYSMKKLLNKYIFYPNVTEEELDMEMWKNTKYYGMKFTREGNWANFDHTYASPVFVFENGDRVVFDRYGEIKEL